MKDTMMQKVGIYRGGDEMREAVGPDADLQILTRSVSGVTLYTQRIKALNLQAKAYCFSEFDLMGLAYIPSEPSFFMVDVGMTASTELAALDAAIAAADDPVLMARAMKLGIEAGRAAYLAGRMPARRFASASSPLDGLFFD